MMSETCVNIALRKKRGYYNNATNEHCYYINCVEASHEKCLAVASDSEFNLEVEILEANTILGTLLEGFSRARRLRIEFQSNRSYHLTLEGIETFHNLVSIEFKTRAPNTPCAFGQVENKPSICLNGIEFCSNLRYLNCGGMELKSVAPLSHLEFNRLDISSNPIEHLGDIRAKELTISFDQLDLVKEAIAKSSVSDETSSLHVETILINVSYITTHNLVESPELASVLETLVRIQEYIRERLVEPAPTDALSTTQESARSITQEIAMKLARGNVIVMIDRIGGDSVFLDDLPSYLKTQTWVAARDEWKAEVENFAPPWGAARDGWDNAIVYDNDEHYIMMPDRY